MQVLCSYRGRTHKRWTKAPEGWRSPGRLRAILERWAEAGERSAVIYTLLGSCRRHGITPFDYLKDLFTRLPGAKITQIKEFTPATWFNAKAKDKLTAQAT